MPVNKHRKLSPVLSLAVILLLLIFLIVLEQHQASNRMVVAVLQKGAILAVAAVAMNLPNGFTGIFSLGMAGFMSIGAYITAILTIPTDTIESVYYISGVAGWVMSIKRALDGLPQPLLVLVALLIGGLVASLFAFLIGIPVLRFKSDYLAIATLGFSEIIRALVASPQLDRVTNGSYGLKNIPGFATASGSGALLIPFAIAAVCIFIMVLVINSSYGRAFKAIREDDIAAEAMGINLLKHKELSFVISSFFTAISGGMLAMYMRSIDSKTFQVSLTYDILLIVVIGGMGSVTGSIISAFLITASKEWWLRFFDQTLYIGNWQVPLLRTGFRMVVFSVLLMVVVLFYRRGLMGDREFSWEDILGLPRRWRRRRAVTAAARADAAEAKDGGKHDA
ncbi:branched-chain amino acid ABC transporter permease [Oscillospiraceae bacterium HV4-5-C5C]|nr:branched-chain amino acid ABC transporter permease [Oscillospiraceae bacterium HV4-5-C5C]